MLSSRRMAATPLELIDAQRSELTGRVPRLRLGLRAALRRFRFAAQPGGAVAARAGRSARGQGASGGAPVGAGGGIAGRRAGARLRAEHPGEQSRRGRLARRAAARALVQRCARARRGQCRRRGRAHGAAHRPLRQPVAPRPSPRRRGGAADRRDRVAPDAGISRAPAAAADAGRIGRGPRASDPHAAGRGAAVCIADDACRTAARRTWRDARKGPSAA